MTTLCRLMELLWSCLSDDDESRELCQRMNGGDPNVGVMSVRNTNQRLFWIAVGGVVGSGVVGVGGVDMDGHPNYKTSVVVGLLRKHKMKDDHHVTVAIPQLQSLKIF